VLAQAVEAILDADETLGLLVERHAPDPHRGGSRR